MRFVRARLTTFDDPHYRAFVEQMTIARENQRATRPPRQRDLFGGEAEQLLREWLTAQGQALSERRILEYDERSGRQTIRKYREIDALVEVGRSVHVFEVKASRSAHTIRKAATQLHDIRAALQLIIPRVYTTLLLVDTGIPDAEAVQALMRSPDAPHTPPPTIADIIGNQSRFHLIEHPEQAQQWPDQISIRRFSLDQLVAMAGDRPLHLDWALDDDEEVPSPLPIKRQTVADDPDDDTDNPFAALLGAL
ncbi:hypothetical protein [Herpetosiphon sp. NSE202]|uniref:hypothetical protein n=1 Tax=Herpetosiphon sp. NSE202 TaxID=3351349 RepID=UPI0036289992